MSALVTITTFSGLAPPWSLSQLDTNLQNLQTAIQNQNTFSNYLTDTGAANAYVVTPAAGITGTLTAGLMLQFKAANANTGASTLNYNALGVKNILNVNGSALGSGQIPLNGVAQVIYDGTQFLLLNSDGPTFTSAETAISGVNTTVNIPHGLGVVPRWFFVTIRCKTAEFGYSVGDEVNYVSTTVVTATADITNISLVCGGFVLQVIRKDTFAQQAITPANWKYVVKVWR